MCGIFAYMGEQNAPEIVFTGLKRLEYRGYDSWGIAALQNDRISVQKKVGAIADAPQLSYFQKTNVSIGHTRWATHGAVSELNAHPHFATDESFVLAQNGIVENYELLKQELMKKGHAFHTQTDTEIIVRLVEEYRKTIPDLQEAIRQTFFELAGRNTIIVLSRTGEIIAARNGSPLVVGIDDKTGDAYFSSDTLSFAPFAHTMIVVENGQIVVCKDKKITLFDIQTGKGLPVQFEKIKITSGTVDKEGYDYFMEKEIHEEPFVIHQLINQDEAEYLRLAEAIKKARTVYTIASGTAGIAASQIALYLRVHAKVNAVSVIGADARDYYDLITKDDLFIAPSQSGETADVLEVLEYVKKKNVKIASFVNMPGSMMTRMSDFKFMADAGPEVCVMSTKVFMSQIAWGYVVAKTVVGKIDEAKQNLKALASSLRTFLTNQKIQEELQALAQQLKGSKNIFLLGKYENFNILKEGMVKLIEGTYIHAHALPAGDLKHYAITLMQKGVPVIAAVSNDMVKSDVMNALSEVRARGATTIVIAPEKASMYDYHIAVPDTGETSAILNVVPLQLLAYYMTVALGNNVDRPRNIAKSVTVK